jgi:hypothetical protein
MAIKRVERALLWTLKLKFMYFEAAMDSEYKAEFIEYPQVLPMIVLAVRKMAISYSGRLEVG